MPFLLPSPEALLNKRHRLAGQTHQQRAAGHQFCEHRQRLAELPSQVRGASAPSESEQKRLVASDEVAQDIGGSHYPVCEVLVPPKSFCGTNRLHSRPWRFSQNNEDILLSPKQSSNKLVNVDISEYYRPPMKCIHSAQYSPSI